MKVWVITKIARQVDGEYVFVNVERVFDSDDKVKNYLGSTPLNHRESIHGPNGSIDCYCERAVIESEVS